MNATYYYIGKTTKSELIKLLVEINGRFNKSDNCKDSNMARKANLLRHKLEKAEELI